LLISSIGFLAIIFSFSYIEKQQNRYYTVLLLLLAASTGVVLTADIFNMFVFFEILCISSYVLVAYHRQSDSFEAAFKYLVQGSIGSAFILIAIGIIYGMFGTLNLAQIAQGIVFPLKFPLKVALALFIAGFGVEAAIFPLHSWLPDAHPAAPSPVSALLSGVAIKVGLYAVIRIVFTIFGYKGIFLPLLFLAALTFIIGEVSAFRQDNLKRMLAYSSIGQIGLITMAISFGTVYSVTAGFLQVFNHTLSKSLLFLAAGVFFYQRNTLDIVKLKAVAYDNVFVSSAFVIGCLSLIGLPPFFGFLSKLAVIMSFFRYGGMAAYIIIISVIIITAIEAGYFFKVLGVIYQKEESFPKTQRSIRPLFVIPVVVLALSIIVFGLFPQGVQRIAYSAAAGLIDKTGYIKSIFS